MGHLYESYLFITDLQAFLQLSPRLMAPAGARVVQPEEPLTIERLSGNLSALSCICQAASWR
jgi:hypothetical protein